MDVPENTTSARTSRPYDPLPLRREPALHGVVVCDSAMLDAVNRLRRAAPAPVNVLLLGETGTGKDALAALLHQLSPRASRPFVRVNCANLPEPLFESELFGHEAGAFTGAAGRRIGLLEAADGGTVFLDEVGELNLTLQAKLLRVVESCEIARVGGALPRRIDVRFVAATNRLLEAEVAAGAFRRDLYHRLNCFTVTLPPLRARPSDIEPLATYFVRAACERFGLPRATLSEACLAALVAHPWTGNVRELRNTLERALLMADGPVLEPRDLELDARVDAPLGNLELGAADQPVPPAAPGRRSALSRDVLARTLALCGGNQTRAAAILGVPRRSMVRLIQQLGLPRPRKAGAGR